MSAKAGTGGGLLGGLQGADGEEVVTINVGGERFTTTRCVLPGMGGSAGLGGRARPSAARPRAGA